MDTRTATTTTAPRRNPAAGAALGLALGLAALLAACSDDGRTPGQKLDAAIGKVEQKADEAKARIDSGEVRERTRDAVEDARDAARKTGEAAREAARDVGAAVSDAAVTAAVKAELARDKDLSALKIDVDTEAGQVMLRGSAPDEAARERATRLAGGVKGARGVDNKLVVGTAR